MPEGDTIFRAAHTLHRALAGKIVTRFESVFPALTRVADDHPIVGRTVESVRSRGKHMLMAFSGGLTLRTHMRMNGSWHIYRPGERWQRPRQQMRIVIETAEWAAVAFNVYDAEFIRTDAMQHHRPIAALGPDLLGDFDRGEALARIRRQGARPVHEVLLD